MNTQQTRKQQKLKIASYMAITLLSATLSILPSEVRAEHPRTPLGPKDTLTEKEALTGKTEFVFMQPKDIKWEVDKNIWRAGKTIEEEAQIDATLLFNTMFSDPAKVAPLKLTSDQIARNNQKQEFLKRLVFTLAYVPLRYKKEGGIEEPWPVAIAIALTHGQRILFKNTGLEADNVYNWLLAGSTTGTPTIGETRLAASHAAEEISDDIIELKLGFFKIHENLKHGKKGHHRFVNIAFGGLGNKDFRGNIIGLDGFRSADPKVQHGHVYIFANTFKSGNSALLIGIESSAPGKENMFGKSHTIMSAFTDPQKEKGVTGGTKMKGVLGDQAPITNGGMIINMNRDLLKEIGGAYNAVSKDADLFKRLLLASAKDAQGIVGKKTTADTKKETIKK